MEKVAVRDIQDAAWPLSLVWLTVVDREKNPNLILENDVLGFKFKTRLKLSGDMGMRKNSRFKALRLRKKVKAPGFSRGEPSLEASKGGGRDQNPCLPLGPHRGVGWAPLTGLPNSQKGLLQQPRR